jgi:hypothetical protein
VRNAFGATVTGLRASQFAQPPAGGRAVTEVGVAPGGVAEKVPSAGRRERFEEVSASGAAEERAAADATPYGRRASDEPPAGAMLFDVLPPLPSARHRVPSEEMKRWGSADSGPNKPGEQDWEALGDTKTVKPFGRSEPEQTENRKSSEAADSNQRLLDILKSLDLDDLPDEPRHVAFDPEHAFRQINRGVWLEFTEAGDGPSYLKVAWVNRRRTVALLVRRSDRRAVSIRFSELQKRFASGRAHLIETSAQ